MGYCKGYKDIRKRRPTGASEINDSLLMSAVKAHRDPKFWKRYESEPDRYAYIRHWATVCRREARRRGLL